MTTSNKPIFFFFKLLNCGACSHFEAGMFQRLIADPEVRQAVNLEQVVFGLDREQNIEYSLDDEFPDFRAKVQYAPYLWLGKAYDESQGHHLNPSTMYDKTLNLRQDGAEFQFMRDTTYEGLKAWILQTARRLQGSTFRSRSTRDK